MTIKRIKDPAGLLPDYVSIDCENMQPGDMEEIRSLFEFQEPSSRIERLRRHPELAELADQLASELAPNGNASIELLLKIAQADTRALYHDAAAANIEKQRRKNSASALTDADIHAVLTKNKGKRQVSAEDLGLNPKQLYNRIVGSEFLRKEWPPRRKNRQS